MSLNMFVYTDLELSHRSLLAEQLLGPHMQSLVNLGCTDPAQGGSMRQASIGQPAGKGITQALKLVQVAVAAQHCQSLLPLVQWPLLHKPCT